MVVDDNLDAAQSLGMLLRMDGHEVGLAHDGFAAVEFAKSIRPDVVLLDIGLPGLDGYEVAQALRADDSLGSLQLIAISGYGREEDLAKTKAAGFDHHLVKPVDFDTLMSIIA